jgi:hypothetical protein
MDSWNGILNLCQVLVLQSVSGKMEFVPDEVLGGYCRGTEKGSEYSKGTAEEMGMVMCD